jgi:dTDP-4-amino-4,6-dideoxygalactose transaminase
LIGTSEPGRRRHIAYGPKIHYASHLYIIRTRKRDELPKYLSENGIGIGIGLHYPIPLHLQKAYVDLGYTEGDFPITEKVASEILSLPMYPQISADQQQYVATKIQEFYSSFNLGS